VRPCVLGMAPTCSAPTTLLMAATTAAWLAWPGPAPLLLLELRRCCRSVTRGLMMSAYSFSTLACGSTYGLGCQVFSLLVRGAW
jgi:hypothetical protein